MEGPRYKEVEDRKRMLKFFEEELVEARRSGRTSLELMIYEGPQVGIGYLGSRAYNGFGEKLGLSGADAVALFERIRDRYLKGDLHNPNANIPMYRVFVRNLSDEGLQVLDLLPQDQLIAALRGVIEAAQDPDAPGTEEEKRDAIQWANDGLTLAQKAEWVAYKVAEYWPA